jgi:hypothetical protein
MVAGKITPAGHMVKGLDGVERFVAHEADQDGPVTETTKTPRLAPKSKAEKKADKAAKKGKPVVETVDAGGGILVDVADSKPAKKAKKVKTAGPLSTEVSNPEQEEVKKTTCNHGVKSNESILWEIADKYSNACATRISDPFTGESTGFAMVHGWDGAAEQWHSVRPVSDRYKPIRTQDLIEIAVERLQGTPLMAEKIRTDRFGTSLEVKIPINRPIEIGKGVAFDQGHPWTRHGEHTKRDVLYPVVNIRNAYDATSSIIVDVGLFRMICSNGMKIMLAGVGAKAIHTKHEVARVIETIAKQELTGDLDFVRKLSVAKLDVKDVAKIMGDRVPEKWQKELAEYAKLGGNTAWSWMNGLSYLSTHEYSLLRSRQLDPIMTAIQKLAA